MRFRRSLMGGLTIAFVGFALMVATTITEPSIDFAFYREIGERWLADGTYYLPRQLEGPYQLAIMVDVLYPPTALFLFVPLAVLPVPLAALAWWGIPLALIAWLLVVTRPGPWALLVILALAAWPRTIGAVAYGNTDLVIAGAVAGGFLYGWPAVLVLVKPTFAPFALIGSRRRSWWLVGALLGLLTLPLWRDYLTALRGLHGVGLDYSVGALPLVLIPVVAWLGAQQREQDDRRVGLRVVQTAIPFRRRQRQEGGPPELPEVAESL